LDTCNIYEDSSLSCEWKYLTYVCIFSVFMLYFTIVGLKEQFWMQICMTVLRIVVMTLVIAACLAAALTNTHIDSVLYNPADIPAAVDFGAIGKALPVIVFASMYQTSLPSIVEQMRNKDRTVPKVLAWTTVTSLFFYLLLGLIVPIAIPDVPSQCSMAFRNYTAGHKVDHRPWWTYALGYLVVIFPALDVFSSFPLCSVALADNLQSLVYGSVPRNSIPRVGFYGVKLFACVPALVIAMLAHNLGTVLDWAGLFGFFLVLFMIPLCHLAGRKVLPIESQYDVRRLPRVSPRQCANWVVAVLVVPLAVIVALEMV
jgi:amino acid permease